MSTSSTVPSEIVWTGIHMWMVKNLINMRMSELLDSLGDDFLTEQERVSDSHLCGMLMGARVDVTVEARKPELRSLFNHVIQAASNWQCTVKVQHSKFRAHVAMRQATDKLWFMGGQDGVQCYSSKADMDEFNRWLALAKLSGHPWFSGLNEQTISASVFRSEDRKR